MPHVQRRTKLMRGSTLGLAIVMAIGCSDQVGDPCEEHNDCDDIRGGYCSLVGVCTLDCSDEKCPDETACVNIGENHETGLPRMICLRSCHEDGDCHDNEMCREEPRESDDSADVCVVAQPLEAL
jgi:hypothetical protein